MSRSSSLLMNEDLSDLTNPSAKYTDMHLDSLEVNLDEVRQVKEKYKNAQQWGPYTAIPKEIQEMENSCKRFCSKVAYWASHILWGFFLLYYVGAYCVGQYGCMIVNLSFFSTSFISYVLSPIHHGFAKEWHEHVFGLIQVLLACPYIQFGLFLIIDWIKELGSIADSLKAAVLASVNISREFMNSIFTRAGWRFIVLLILNYCVPLCLDASVIYWLVMVIIRDAFSVFNVLFLVVYWFFALQGILCCVIGTVNWFIEMTGCNRTEEKILERRRKYIKFDTKIRKWIKHGAAYNVSINGMESLTKVTNFIMKAWGSLVRVLVGLFYVPTFSAVTSYGFYLAGKQKGMTLRRVFTITFTCLNFIIWLFDVCRLDQNPNTFFCVSLAFRLVFIPIVSFFNPFVIFFGAPGDDFHNDTELRPNEDDVVEAQREKTKYRIFIKQEDEDKQENAKFIEEDQKRNKGKIESLRFWMIVSFVITVVALLGGIIVPHCAQDLIDRYSVRIGSLDPFNSTNVPANDVNETSFNHTNIAGYVCSVAHDLTTTQAIGLSFGPYDVTRNPTVFENQMSHFFSPDWKEKIEYEVFYVRDNIPFLKYELKERNQTVISFRGFSSSIELGMQAEILVSHYVLPFLHSMIPLYDYVVDLCFSQSTKIAQNMGFHFYDPNTLLLDYLQPIIDFCSSHGITDDENVIFTGVNVGGTIAKIMGMLMHRPAVSFVALPSKNPLYESIIEFDDYMSLYVTNVYNDGGLFSLEEPGKATNLVIPKIPSSFVDSESVYRSFCAVAELCEEGNHFSQYCESVVGHAAMDEIRNFFTQQAFDPFNNQTSLIYEYGVNT